MQDGDRLTLSVVSHGQQALLLGLLEDLQRVVHTPFRLIVTENIPEPSGLSVSDYSYPIKVIKNLRRKGFGENHNAAFASADGEFFCVLNPDIRLPSDPFPTLLKTLSDERIAVVAPTVSNAGGVAEDHARDFPSVFTLLAKLFGYRPRSRPQSQDADFYPDWVAGMFMLFRRPALLSAGGFDERYFLYYEDVDLCARLRDAGYQVAVSTATTVVHNAQRQSRKSARFAAWHLRSALRFFMTRPRVALGLRKR